MKKRVMGFVLALVIALTSTPVYQVEAEEVQGLCEEVLENIKDEQISYKRNNTTGYIDVELEVETPSNLGKDNSASTQALPTSYQSFEEVVEKYPATRNQDPYGTCWAFGSVACGEFDLVNQGNYSKENADFSELQLAYNMYHPGNDKLGNIGNDATKLASDAYYNYLDMGGNIYFAQHILANWRGLVGENEVPYSDAKSTLSTPLLDSYLYANNSARLMNTRIIDIHEDAESAKRAIYEHGAVYASYFHSTFYVEKNNGLTLYNFTGRKRATNHAIAIVGWDDNFSRNNWNSLNKPDSDGAWLIRNSWSTGNDISETSYFWMSYEDNSLSDSVYMLDYETVENSYDNIYQYDGSASHAGVNAYQVANVFTAQNPDSSPSETLDAVMVSMTSGVSARMNIEVYTGLASETDPESGVLQEASTTSVSTQHAGIYTFKLKNPVKLAQGEKYAIVITTTSEDAYYDIEATDTYYGWVEMTAGIDAGESFWKSDDQSEWFDLVNLGQGYGNICVKGLTNNSQEEIHIHSFEEVIKKATAEADGSVEQHCTTCGYVFTESVILKPEVSLPYKKITYSGSKKTPEVTVTNAEGSVSTASYTVEYKNNLNVGRATVTVQLPSHLYEPVEAHFMIVPKAPASSNARLSGEYDKVKFTWEASRGATGYTVYYKTSTASSYTQLGRTTKTSFTKDDLKDGRKYSFKVVPYVMYDGVRYTSIQAETDAVNTLEKIDKPTVTKYSRKKVRVKWNNIAGESGYQISRSKKSGGTNIVYTYGSSSANSVTLNTTRYITYYYKVRSYRVENGKKIYGPWSNTVKFKLK